MRIETLPLLACPDCRASLTAEGARPFESAEGEILRGIVDCAGCGTWHRIEDGILDLLPVDLRDPGVRRAFATEHDLDGDCAAAAAEADRGLALKREQQQFFSGDVDSYEADVVGHPYFQALDARSVLRWSRQLGPDDWVLDLCAGSGRITVPLAERGARVIALDLTEAMLRKARRRTEEAGLGARVSFVLGDAERLALGDGVLDAGICYGSLHHLPSPGAALAQMGRVLRPGGQMFTMDPNKSPVRWVFDAAMRLRRQWVEEASDQPLQTAAMLRGWCRSAGLEVDIWYSTFVLPHLFTGLGPRAASRLLGITDGMFARLPLVRRFAGIIGARGRKAGAGC